MVFITEHNDEGAMGIVLNRPSDTDVGSVVSELAEIAGGEPIYVGGVARMAEAFASAIKAGRLGFEAGLMPTRDMAVPSTPVAGTPFFDLD